MTLLDSIKKIDAEDAFDLVVKALDTIGSLAGAANAANAKDIVMVIRSIYEAVTNAAEGRVTREEVEDQLAKFLEGMQDNDAEADAAVDAKFDKG